MYALAAAHIFELAGGVTATLKQLAGVLFAASAPRWGSRWRLGSEHRPENAGSI
jgi:hypothetical protein